MSKKKVTKKTKSVAKGAASKATRKTKATRRVPAPKATRSVLAPKGTARTMTAGDLRRFMMGIEEWVRYVRELIGTLPAGTRIDPLVDIAPAEEFVPWVRGKCWPPRIGAIGPPPPPEMTVGDVQKILIAIEDAARDVRERVGP